MSGNRCVTAQFATKDKREYIALSWAIASAAGSRERQAIATVTKSSVGPSHAIDSEAVGSDLLYHHACGI